MLSCTRKTHSTNSPPSVSALVRRNTRNAIVEAAAKLFIEHGYNRCSVQDITNAAGVPKGSFYNHFKTKEGLAVEILMEYGKGATDRSALTDPSLPALTRLKKHFAALNAHFSVCHDGCLVGEFMTEVSADTPKIRDGLKRVGTSMPSKAP